MKERVYIKIKGLQMSAQLDDEQEDADEVEIINVGTYSVVNGKEYIKYEEIYEGHSETCSNLIKISPQSVEVTKRGAVVAHLTFVQGEKTMTAYETGFGNLYLGIFARKIDIHRSEDEIRILIDYSMELNYEMISDCSVEMVISSEGKFQL